MAFFLHVQSVIPPGNPFRLMSPSKNESFKVQLMDLSFKVCTVKPDPRVIVGHAEAFKISPACYYYNDVDVKALSVCGKGSIRFHSRRLVSE